MRIFTSLILTALLSFTAPLAASDAPEFDSQGRLQVFHFYNNLGPDLKFMVMQQLEGRDRYALACANKLHRDLYINRYAFTPDAIDAFAKHVICAMATQWVSRQDIVDYFDIATDKGKRDFLGEYGCGLPDLVRKGIFNEYFNPCYVTFRRRIKKEIDDKKPVLNWFEIAGDREGMFVIPSEVGELSALAHFSNTLSSLSSLSHAVLFPKSMERLVNLTNLKLKDTPFREVPCWVGSLVNLEYLYLSNHIEKLPRFLSKIKHLKELVLEGNRLTEIPDWISNFSCLESLVLSYNRIEKLPESILLLPKLKSLCVWQNPLKEVDSRFLSAKFNIFGYPHD